VGPKCRQRISANQAIIAKNPRLSIFRPQINAGRARTRRRRFQERSVHMNTSRRRVVLALGSTVLVPLMGVGRFRANAKPRRPRVRSAWPPLARSLAAPVAGERDQQPAITASTARSMTSAPLAAPPVLRFNRMRRSAQLDAIDKTQLSSRQPGRPRDPRQFAARTAFGRPKAGRPGRGIRWATNRSPAERFTA
jgi:hypothetical protein